MMSAKTTVEVPLPVCPFCGWDEYRVHSTYTQADGSRVRYCECCECGRRFKIHAKRPAAGS